MIALIANICLTCFSQAARREQGLGPDRTAGQNQTADQNWALGQNQAARQSWIAGWSWALDRLRLEPGEPRAYGGDDHGRQHVCRLEGTRPDEVDPYAEDED